MLNNVSDTPVVVPLCFETNLCKKKLTLPLLPSKWFIRLFIFANEKYVYEWFKIFIRNGTHCMLKLLKFLPLLTIRNDVIISEILDQLTQTFALNKIIKFAW